MCKALDCMYPAFATGRLGAGLLALRLVVGIAFILHGWPKVQNLTTWMGDAPVFLQVFAALAEFGGGIALVLGLLTPLACLALMATMLGAMFMVHIPAGDPFVAGGPDQGSYELALVYFVCALLILLAGPGAYSADAFIFNKPQTPSTPDSGASG